MQTLWQDLRFGARMLIKQPGFTLVAVVTVALGIGANTALFSVVNAVLLNALPFAEAERLVALGETTPRNRTALSNTSYRNFMDWQARNQVFAELAAYYGSTFTLTGQGEVARLRGTVVTHNLFAVLQAQPLLGRTFLPEDDKPGGGGAGRPVILSWECWQQYFSGDANILGRTLKLNGEAYVVVGVMPAAFAFPIEAQPTLLWTSTARDAERTGQGAILEARGYRGWRALARLQPGVSVAQAQAAMNVIAGNLAAEYPDANRDAGIRVVPLLDALVSNIRTTLWLLLGAVGCVLLIACVNVANLLLERALARQQELTVRLAVGASRWRLARQLVTGSLLLALAAVGIYGVMSYAVEQSTREIGIRVALGAQTAHVLRLVVGQGLALTISGLSLGLLGALGLTSLMKSLLFGVGATDPLTFAGAALLLALVALIGC